MAIFNVGEGAEERKIGLSKGADTFKSWKAMEEVFGSKDLQSAFSELLEDADIALYHAKGSGKNRMVVAENSN